MNRIILVTAYFPYQGGEQFLETEAKYYCENKDIDFTILPTMKNQSLRKIPGCIAVDDFLICNKWNKIKLYYLIRAMFSKLFYKELFSENFLNLKKLKIFFSSITLYQFYFERLDKYLKKIDDPKNTVFYTYWNNEATYALQSLKNKYRYKLISRIHGGDLYKERKSFEYMPLKKQFTKNIDVVYTITQSANIYLESTYGFDKKTLQLARLGVEDRKIITRSSPENSLNIVSCSFLAEVKQVDKIIKSLKVIATQMRDISFNWIHIGDGILYDDLTLLAKEELDDLDNVKYDFVGNYSNEKVYELYLENEVDVFLNVSESEGVPVSIMEAMSCHIPIVAPDVGGIKDMVLANSNGLLLSKKFLIDEIVNSLKNIEFFKNKDVRKNSYKIFLEKYNAKRNYKEFIQDIIKIGMDK